MTQLERFSAKEIQVARIRYNEIVGASSKILNFRAYIGEEDRCPDSTYFCYNFEAANRIRNLSTPHAKALIMAYWAQREDRDEE